MTGPLNILTLLDSNSLEMVKIISHSFGNLHCACPDSDSSEIVYLGLDEGIMEFNI